MIKEVCYFIVISLMAACEVLKAADNFEKILGVFSCMVVGVYCGIGIGDFLQ